MEHGGTNVEVRPGNAVFKQLFDVVTSTAERLDGIWEHVGCSAEERKEHLDGLVKEFRKLCAAKVQEEESVRDQFLVSIEQLKEEIVSLSNRLGETAEYPLATGAEGNLTDRLGDLEVRVEELRQRSNSQMEKANGLREKAVGMLRRMGGEVEPELEDQTDISNKKISWLEERWLAVEAEAEQRSKVITTLVADCQALMKELKMELVTALDQQIMGSLTRGPGGSWSLASLDASASCVGLHADVVTRLADRANELNAEKRVRTEKLKALGDQIAELWNRLKVPESVREAFSSSVAGLGHDTLEAGERELARLMLLKKEMLGSLIQDARTQMSQLWDEMEVAAAEREDFAPLAVGPEGYCDDLLAVHEQEVARLSSRLEQVRPILKMIAKRQEIVKERVEMEELQKDSSRLTDRAGGKRVTEELMRLEKMQKRVKKDLPLLTDKLKKRLVEWEKTESEGNGQPFRYRGTPYLQRMEEEEDEWNNYKETLRLEKEAKKREELEKYKQNTPGLTGNLLPRGGAGPGPSASLSASATKAPLSSSLSSAKKPGLASSAKKPPSSSSHHASTAPSASSSKPSATCSSSNGASSLHSYETPVKASATTTTHGGNKPSGGSSLRQPSQVSKPASASATASASSSSLKQQQGAAGTNGRRRSGENQENEGTNTPRTDEDEEEEEEEEAAAAGPEEVAQQA